MAFNAYGICFEIISVHSMLNATIKTRSMKTIFTLLTTLFMSIAVFAADAKKPMSAITIRSLEQTDIRVMIDGRRFEPGHNSMMLRQVDAGKHDIRIYREIRRGGVFSRGSSFELVYDRTIKVKPGTHILISIDRAGRPAIQEQKMKRIDRRDQARNDRNDDWFEEYDYDFRNGERFGDYDDNFGYERGMNDRDFRSVLQAMEKEWFEGNKIKSATHVVKNNRLTTAQVKQIMQLFSFENNKLEVAKQAYANTVDKRNFSSVNDLFSFQNSKDELARFIRNFR